MRILAAVAAVLSAASAQAQHLADPAPIVAAERAFAAETGRVGIPRGFRAFAAPDAIMINSGVTRVHETLDANSPTAPPQPSLIWFPIWAGIARSGDLGFTSGPVEFGGRRGGTYFTIWQRQPDGGWKWVYDGGLGAASADVPGPDSVPAQLPVAMAGAPTADAAMAEVRDAEAALARQAATDQRAAHIAWYAPAGRLHVAPHPPARTPEAVQTLLRAYPATLRFVPPLGGGASSGGDLAWTYGRVDGTAAAPPLRGHYVHVWQRQPDGWRLVFSQILTGEPPPSQ